MIPSILDDALGFNIYRVSLLFRRELIRALADLHMTPEQWQIMITLWTTKKSLNQTQIVNLTMKDKPTVSRIIQRLERDGWVLKTGSEDDKRVTLIRPSRRSWKLYREVPQKLSAHFDTLLQDFPQEKKDQLLKILKELRLILES